MFFAVVPKHDCPHLDEYMQESFETKTSDTGKDVCESLPPILKERLLSIYQRNSVQGSCSVCADESENWCCLNCSNLFCSRYVKSHMESHFSADCHTLALSLTDGSIWCYACDSYVWNARIKPFSEAFGDLKHSFMTTEKEQELVHKQLQQLGEAGELVLERLENLCISEDVESEKGRKQEIIKIQPENDFEAVSRVNVNIRTEIDIVPTTQPKKWIMACYFNEKCEFHCIPNHVEQPNRVKYILMALKKSFPESVSFRECAPATEDHLKLFHSEALIDTFNGLAEKAITKEKVNVIYHSVNMF